MAIENNDNSIRNYYGYDEVLLVYGDKTDAEIEKIISQGLNDYNKGTPFPLNDRFNGLDNYRIVCELDNTVIAVRKPDLTYATWEGDSIKGVNFGHYMMSRESAMEDFAVRAKLIDNQRYITKEEYTYMKQDGRIPERIMDDISENLQDNLDSYGSDGFTFCVISCEGNSIATYHDMMDYDTFYAHIRELYDENNYFPDGDYVDFRVTEYKYGDGKSTATDKQIDYINSHLDNVMLFSQATNYENFEVNKQYLLNFDMGEYHGR